MIGELEILSRAHGLFAGGQEPRDVRAATAHQDLPQRVGPAALPAAYRDAAEARRAELSTTGRIDAELAAILRQAHRDRSEARVRTGAVLSAAQADAVLAPDNPVAHRELTRRRATRLRPS